MRRGTAIFRSSPVSLPVVSLAVAMLFCGAWKPTSRGDVFTWDGGSSAFGNDWSADFNWSPNGAPPTASGAHSFIFSDNNPRPSPNFEASYTINSLTFGAGGGAFGFTGSGGTQTLTINGGGILNSSGSAQSFGNSLENISLGASQTWNAGPTAGGSLSVASAVILGPSRTLTIEGANNTTMSGAVSGTGTSGIIKNGTGSLTLEGGTANTYPGTTTINAGSVILNKTAGVNALAGPVIIGDGTGSDTLQLNASNQIADASPVTINSSGVFNLNGQIETIGALTGAAGSSITLGTGQLLTSTASNTTYAGVISGTAGATSGTGGWSKLGTGTLSITGTANAYSGVTSFEGGIVNVANLSNYGVNGSLGNRLSSAETTTNIGLRFQGGTLQYTGSTAQSTDRDIRVGLSGGTIDASGTNPAATMSFTKSTPNVDIWDSAGSRTLTLTGTNTGNNTFAINWQAYGSGAASNLVKTGSGTWVLTNPHNSDAQSSAYNTFGGYGGGTELNGGTLGFVNGAIGGGVVDFTANATLRWEAGNTQDISTGTGAGVARSVRIGDGVTATFDTNGNNVTLGTALTVGPLASGALTKAGSGTLTLSAGNTYTGATTVSGGTLALTGAGALADSSPVNLTGDSAAFNISGIAAAGETVGSLAGVAGSSVELGGKNLTAGGNGASTVFAGVISGSGGSLTKNGGGTLTLSGANTYTGATVINGGTLLLGASNVLPGGNLELKAGTKLNTGGNSDATGALLLSGSSTIDMINGSSKLAFDNSSGMTWSAGILSIWNWSLNAGTVRFGSTAGGLTAAQLSQIRVYSGAGSGSVWTPTIDANGFLVVVPEPGALLAGLLLLGGIGWRERSHFLRMRNPA